MVNPHKQQASKRLFQILRSGVIGATIYGFYITSRMFSIKTLTRRPAIADKCAEARAFRVLVGKSSPESGSVHPISSKRGEILAIVT